MRSQNDIDDYVARNPHLPQAHVLRGHSLMLDGDLENAEKEFNYALKLDPHCVNGMVGRSRIFQANGHLQKALDELVLAAQNAEGEKKLRVVWEEGYICRENKKFPLAIEKFNELMKLKFPDQQRQAFAMLMRGESYAHTGDVKSALKDFNESIRLDPWAISAYTSRGEALERTGHDKEALADYSRAIDNGVKNNPDFGSVGVTQSVAGAYRARARVERRLGQNKQADEDLQKIRAQENEYMDYAPFSIKK